jgi:hypothetical protein
LQSPLALDVKHLSSRATPEDWKGYLKTPTIDVLPLAREENRQRMPGWCTYTYEHESAPELEVLCGGINGKTPRAGAVWRQGHLLHFGFDLSPAEMNSDGQALLLNAIAYIARFTEDRPIVRTPCVFVQGRRIFDRGAVGRLLARGGEVRELEYYVSKETFAGLKGQDRDAVAAWYKNARDYLHADAEGKLAVDDEARSLGVCPASPEFLNKTVAALADKMHATAARELLLRYVPDGPGRAADGGAWQKWLHANRNYLFFSDTGGYHWYVDPLARRRQVPTEKLRGPARATLLAVKLTA